MPGAMGNAGNADVGDGDGLRGKERDHPNGLRRAKSGTEWADVKCWRLDRLTSYSFRFRLLEHPLRLECVRSSLGTRRENIV